MRNRLIILVILMMQSCRVVIASNLSPLHHSKSIDAAVDIAPLKRAKKKRPGKMPQTDLQLRSMTMEDVEKIPLCELVDLIPRYPGNVVGKLYDHLFCMHPDVIEIVEGNNDREEIAKAWSDLRVQEMKKGLKGKHLRRLTASIEHLYKDDPDLMERINSYWTNVHTRIESRRKSERRKLSGKMEDLRPYWRQKAREAKVREEQGIDISFQHYLNQYQVSVEGLNAAEIERVTRFFYREMESQRSGVTRMGQYLKEKGLSDVEVEAAMGSRRVYMRKERFRRYHANKKSVISLKGDTPATIERPSLAYLSRLSQWWTA